MFNQYFCFNSGNNITRNIQMRTYKTDTEIHFFLNNNKKKKKKKKKKTYLGKNKKYFWENILVDVFCLPLHLPNHAEVLGTELPAQWASTLGQLGHKNQ